MHSAAAATLAGLLIAGPTLLAFFSGGYFDRPRLIAAILAWLAVIAAVVLAKHPLPRHGAGRLALAGLAALCAWTALSLLWTPLGASTGDDIQRLLLYLGYLLACVVLFRAAWVERALEPALAAGTLVVTGYALSERLVPDLVTLSQSVTAGGRLEQPLTYWNASGALAAMGLVLCVRIAGDTARDARLRAAGAAVAVPLAAGAYLSLSRGVIAATAVGLAVLVALAPDGRAQLRACAVALVTCLPAAVVAGALPAVRTLGGSAGAQRVQGLAMLVVLVGLAALAAFLTGRGARAARPSSGPLTGRRRALATAGVAVALVGALLAAAAFESGPEAQDPQFGANPDRLRSLDSNRYEYWAVALEAFAEHPLLGTGSGGFGVEWLRERDVDDPTREPHSLYLGTLSELGLAGFAALLAFVAGVALALRGLWRRRPGLAAGPAAALAVFAGHAAIDWDWELPALALVALALAGAAIAWLELEGAPGAKASEPAGSARASGPEPLASAPGRSAR